MSTTPTAAPLTDGQRELLTRMSAPPGEREGLFPVTAAQRGLWLLAQLRPDGTAYHMPALLWLRGPLDPERFATAVQHVVDRHESLRTTFVAVDGTPLQRVRARCPAAVSIVDATYRAPDDLVHEAIDAARRPFDLGEGPLLRATLWRRAPDDHLALLVVHHIVCDGWSVGVLFADLVAALDGIGAGVQDGATPRVEPVDLALREVARADDEEAVSAWAAELADSSPSGLPWRRGEPGCAVREAAVPAPAMRVVRDFARSSRTTEHAVELAAVAAVLARYAGRTDVVLGVPVASRTAATQHTVGLLVSGLPARVTWSGDPTFADLTALASRAVRSLSARASVSPDRLLGQVSRLHPDARPALFDVMLSAEPTLLPEGHVAGLAVEQVPVPPVAAKFPLTVGIRHGRDGAKVVCEVDTAVLTEDFAAGFAAAVGRLLAAGSSAPHLRLSQLPLLDALGSRRRLDAGRGTAAARAEGLGARVLAVARDVPDRIAITSGGSSLGYGELVARAGRLAARLADQPDVRTRPVAVCLPSGPDLAVACLGAVLAGRALLRSG